MDLSGIISIAGYPGLYKVIAQSKNGIIVESLIDKKRMPAYSTYKISALSDISVFTTEEDLPLSDVMQKIAEKEKEGPSSIDSSKASFDEVKNYLLSVVPAFDQERVHFSDMKKMITWYNLLQKNDLLKEKEAEKAAEEVPGAEIKLKKEVSVKPKIKPVESGSKPKSTASKAKQTSTIRKTGA
jgi:hypothetical protein